MCSENSPDLIKARSDFSKTDNPEEKLAQKDQIQKL